MTVTPQHIEGGRDPRRASEPADDEGRAIREAGLLSVRFHDLRHTCATLLLSKGTHVKLVQELLGHATIAVTLDTYSHVLPGMGHGLANTMDEALGQPVAVIDELQEAWETISSRNTHQFSLQTVEKAERVGFEPTRRLHTAYANSNRAPSANSDTSPEATDGSLPKSETAATADSLARLPS